MFPLLRMSCHCFLTQISGINWKHSFPFTMGHPSMAGFSFGIYPFLSSMLWTSAAIFWEWVVNWTRRLQPGSFLGSVAEHSVRSLQSRAVCVSSVRKPQSPTHLESTMNIQEANRAQQSCHKKTMRWWSLVPIFLPYRNNQLRFRVIY